MANRRFLQTLIRHGTILSSTPSIHRALPQLHTLSHSDFLLPKTPNSKSHHLFRNLEPITQYSFAPHFSSKGRNGDSNDEEVAVGEEEEEEEEEEEDSDGEEDEDEDVSVSNCDANRTYSAEEKEQEAAAIGYKVFGPLDRSQRPFKPYEPVFAVVQIGSHQFKVSNGDYIYTERLKFCEVNDKLMLNKVLLLGSKNQTIVGRPMLPDAAVHAVVEEHALDAKVIIFKKKRRKNYRRTKGHRQELTRLRVIDIQGIEKPVQAVAAATTAKPKDGAGKKQNKEPIAA